MDPTLSDVFGLDQTGVSQGTGVGVQGHSPLLSAGGGVAGCVNKVWDWLNQPFAGTMSPAAVSLLVGVILISIILWNFILYHIRIAAESI
jgi:hypothetical protein